MTGAAVLCAAAFAFDALAVVLVEASHLQGPLTHEHFAYFGDIWLN